MICQFASWLLLLHLVYYTVSYRISILTSNMDTLIKQDTSLRNSVGSNFLKVKILRTCSYHFQQICLALNEINSTFSISVLLNVIILLIMCTTSLCVTFLAITAKSNSIPSVIQDSSLVFLGIAIYSIVIICIILKSVESPIHEVGLPII